MICWFLLIAVFIFQILFESHCRREANINSGVHCPKLEGGRELSSQVSASVFEIIGYFDDEGANALRYK